MLGEALSEILIESVMCLNLPMNLSLSIISLVFSHTGQLPIIGQSLMKTLQGKVIIFYRIYRELFTTGGY